MAAKKTLTLPVCWGESGTQWDSVRGAARVL